MIDFSKLPLGEKIKIGVQRGVAKALQRHKDQNQPICVCKDGKVVMIPPKDIKVPSVD